MSNCPFDTRLWRTPYLVLPKMALQAMPIEWRIRMDALLEEMEQAGIETPTYLVFRDVTDDNPGMIKGAKVVNRETGYARLTGGFSDDPWANYRHGDITKLCPNFQRSDDQTA